MMSEEQLVSIEIDSGEPTGVGLTERKTIGTNSNEHWEEKFFIPDESETHKGKTMNVKTILRSIWSDRESKKLSLYVSVLAVVTLVQLLFGSWSGSLSLVAAGFHATFECLAMLISLVAMALAKQPPTPKYSYGLARFEVVAGFSNGVFLMFASLFVVFEVAERLLAGHPHETDASLAGVVTVAVASGVVSGLGALMFPASRLLRAEERLEPSRLEPPHRDIHPLAFRVAMDTVGSVAAILAVYLTRSGFALADPLLAMGLVALIIYNAYPLCFRAGMVLLQTMPLSIKDQLDKAVHEAGTLEGVLECKKQHFWTSGPGIFVGSLHVRVRTNTSEDQQNAILLRVRSLFAPYISHLTIQLEKDDWHLPQQNVN